MTEFRYFTHREVYLHWLSSPDGQVNRRKQEALVFEAARTTHVTFHCYAHAGLGQSITPSLQEEASNWRESGRCSVCKNITRVRLAAEWVVRAALNYRDPRIYLTEQRTPLYKTLRKILPNVVGSEYVPDALTRIRAIIKLVTYTLDVTARIRHEDVCQLTFPDNSFDLIGSFDVLQHVHEYEQAIGEFYRVLSVGGQLLLTAPFLAGSAKTLVRARIENGVTTHLEPAEYHGNPTKPRDGLLCYYHFGWDLLDTLRNAGFRSVALLDAWGVETAIFGDQSAIVATK